jgi:hypothetical protein
MTSVEGFEIFLELSLEVITRDPILEISWGLGGAGGDKC